MDTGSLFSDETKNKSGSDGVHHVWHGHCQNFHNECVVLNWRHGGGSVPKRRRHL